MMCAELDLVIKKRVNPRISVGLEMLTMGMWGRRGVRVVLYHHNLKLPGRPSY